MKPDTEKLLSEVTYKTSRSSGKGGQHVNKVSTKVELTFDVKASNVLDEKQKEIIFSRLLNKLTLGGKLKLICQQSRSQFHNTELVQQKFIRIIEKCFVRQRARVVSQPNKSSIEKRLTDKKKLSEKKQLRKDEGVA